ncbi:peptidoglycan DD-metalloendopeptidase family protein [Seonamhaeicola algicola]|uniref:Peptidoglycan DD-metalloendopeptidase family protein n=2 Tax=Seonamhaeicola TaxID=1649495 RepID=A0A5C7ATJ2_9FLAO|nr:peptidoglycan DD-metalloendopeptidase family protein [Seonamhaeicola algicola]TXE12056.1 peptidoglycan DD-metalloendopeptidase family protein [Seonamhaeicola algicola]
MALHTFLNSISSEPLHVLSEAILISQYVKLNLSEDNEALKQVDVSSPKHLGNFINQIKAENNALVAFGGYKEVRGIYRRSNHFSNPEQERNIHLGVDLWIDANTPIFAPLDGRVHSFKNNINFGDYGPTIILEHTVNNIVFHTLYGHLSLQSIQQLKVGKTFVKGEPIATLGDETVNGNYPPHLHFQIIKDLQGCLGDYPGVCSKKDLNFYSENCPDPNILLKLT